MLGLGSSLAKGAVTILSYIKDNLKIYFDFKSSRAKTLEFVGTGSVYFDGSNDYITITALNLTGAFSFAFWVKPDDITSYDAFMGSSGDYFRIQANGNTTVFNNDAGSVTLDITSNPLIENAWNHIVFTRDSSDNVKWYTNGILAASDSRSGTVDYNFIGSKVDPSSSTREGYFGGNMAQIGIWERKLSTSEIQNIIYKTYDDLKGTEKTHLLHWYPLDSDVDSEGVTNTYKDSHGTNHGTNSGSTLKDGVYADYSPKKPRGFDNAPTAQADLIGSGSASFVTTGESTEDYIDCGDGAHTGEGKDTFTCTAWIKFDDAKADTYGRIIGKGSDDCWQFHIQESDRSPQVFVNNVLAESGHTLTQNKWHHVAFTYTSASNGTVKFYVDGVLVHTDDTVSGSTIGTNDHNLIIGADESLTSQGFGGNIAQVGLWERVLTQEEIQSVKEKTYSELITSEKASILCYYGLDAGVDSTTTGQRLVYDETNATLESTPTIDSTANSNTAGQTLGIPTSMAKNVVNGAVYKMTLTMAEESRVDLQHNTKITGSNVVGNPLTVGEHVVYVLIGDTTLDRFRATVYVENAISHIKLEKVNGNPGRLL